MSTWIDDQLQSLTKTLQQTTELPEAKRRQIVTEIQKIQDTPLTTDKWIYRTVVMALSVAITLSLGFSFWFVMTKEPTAKLPDIFISLGSACVGALAGLLAPPPAGR